MSQENVETLQRIFDEVNVRLDVPQELFDPALSSFSRSSATAESSGTRRHAGNHAPLMGDVRGLPLRDRRGDPRRRDPCDRGCP
jgi:hypothetical protein